MSLRTMMDQYLAKDIAAFHMPGHKRADLPVWPQEALQRDLTEVDEMDDLHHPNGVLRELQESIAERYGSRRSFCLVNGSSGGILAAMAAATKPGDLVLVARNCHKSVYHGLQLAAVRVRYLYPRISDQGVALGLRTEQVVQALDEIEREQGEQPRAVILTSPTYEGVTSEVAGIADLLHQRGIILIVDEAHGAHFRYHALFPQSAVDAGADLVIQSLHKTLPALTQTALLHWQGELVEEERLAYYLQVFQTSSPSYVFLQNIESCLHFVGNGRIWQDYAERLQHLRTCLIELGTPGLYLWTGDNDQIRECDPGKLVLAAPGRGRLLYRQLRERFGIQAEMYLAHHCLLMTTVADHDAMYQRLIDAMRSLVQEPLWQAAPDGYVTTQWVRSEPVLLPFTAMHKERDWRPLPQCEGRLAAGTVYPYPPGIPLTAPGERINQAVLAVIEAYIDSGLELIGPGIRQEAQGWQLAVIKEEA